MLSSIRNAVKLCSLPALLLVLFCCVPVALAQPAPNKLNQYQLAEWTAKQGFSSGRVEALAQTPDGYLWIGTTEGLLRFDGVRYVPILTDHHQPLRQILGLAVDTHGALWVRAADTRIRQVHGETISPPISSDGRLLGVVSMAAAKRGGVYVTDMHKSAYRLDEKRVQVLPIHSRSLLLSIADAGDGRLWIGTDRGLSLSAGAGEAEIVQGKINCLLPEDGGRVWVGTDNGLKYWDGKQLVSAPTPDRTMQHLQVLTIMKDHENTLWVGTSLGLLRYGAGGPEWANTGPENQKPVTALLQDREGDIWFGAGSSLERLTRTPIAAVSFKAATAGGSFGPVYVDPHGRVWYAGLEHGLSVLEGGVVKAITSDGLATDQIYSIDGYGDDVWVGRRHGGLTRLRFDHGTHENKTWTAHDGLSQSSVFAVRAAPEGDVWIGTLTGGLNLFSKGRFTHFDERDGLPANDISAIEFGKSGEVWIGTSNGVCRMEHSRCLPLSLGRQVGGDDILALLKDSDDALWIGTSKGLLFVDKQGPHEVSLGPGPPQRIIGLGVDASGKLLIVCDHSVLSAMHADLLASKSASIQTYGIEDGLGSVEGVHRFRTVVSDNRGQVWFTTAHELATVGPTPLPLPTVIPHIEEISADGVTLDRKDARTSPGAKRISFFFTGLDLHAPSRVRYRYRLDAFDKTWSEVTDNREASYTNLAPGKYLFRLIATNDLGTWNSTESTAEVAVTPYLWQRWSIRSLIAACVVICALLSYRARTNFLLLQANMLANERLRERTRIARDIHDTLLQGFISSLMHLHVAQRNLEHESPLKQQFAFVLEGMERVIEDARLAVMGLRTPGSGQGSLESSLQDFFQEIADIADADLTVRSKGEPRRLNAAASEHISAIIKEAVLNAMRHARSRSVTLTIKWGWTGITLSVLDDGCGIEPHMLEHGRAQHWGLVGMRERAKQLKGRLEITSRPGSGTMVRLSVPATLAYRSSRDASENPAGVV